MSVSPKIFCALDTADLERAVTLAKTVGPIVGGIKLGLEFFNTFGPDGLEKVRESAPDSSLFVDLKYHDIPNTVAGAVKTLSHRIQPAYLNIHASGGAAMMKAAKEACHPHTKLLAVTILTSFDENGMAQAGYKSGIEERVKQMALLAQENGMDGVVCSAKEIVMLRETCDPDFALMVPGIRPAGADVQDQKRVMTPKQALDLGATHLVIGRPITGAEDPAAAAQAIMDDLNS